MNQGKYSIQGDGQEASPQEKLNAGYTPLTFQQRLEKLFLDFAEEDILVTSSFGTKSVFLLHLLHQIRPDHPVYFIDTTYHFEETLSYKRELTELFKFNVINVLPDPIQNRTTLEEEWWEEHAQMCCTINKVAPLEPLIARHKIWISGLMAYQTPFRSGLQIFENRGDILKFHPLIDIDEGEFLYHMDHYKLPRHPLEAAGYGSIGCVHCTRKGEGRSGRWAGQAKTECGLHPNYFGKKDHEDDAL